MSRDNLLIWTTIIIVSIIFVRGILGLAGLLNNYTCHRYSHFTSLQTRTGWPNACYVKTPNGQWIISDNYIIYGDKK